MTCKENFLSFIKLFSFSQKGYFIIYNEKNAFCSKRGCFIGPQNQRFRLKKGWFFVQNPRKGGVFFKLGYEHGIRFGGESEWVGGVGGGREWNNVTHTVGKVVSGIRSCVRNQMTADAELSSNLRHKLHSTVTMDVPSMNLQTCENWFGELFKCSQSPLPLTFGDHHPVITTPVVILQVRILHQQIYVARWRVDKPTLFLRTTNKTTAVAPFTNMV